MKIPKATKWPIKNFDKLAPYHRKLLTEQLNPNYRPVRNVRIIQNTPDNFNALLEAVTSVYKETDTFI